MMPVSRLDLLPPLGMVLILVAARMAISPALAEEMPIAGGEPVRLPVRPFGVGESFKFSLQYGPIKAGTATLTVEGLEEVDGVVCYRLASTARSNRVFSTFYKVRDRVESFIDLEDLATRRSTKDLREKDYRRQEVVVWDQTAGQVTYQDGQLHEIDAGTRDILGAFYYVRTFDFSVGDRIPLQAHDNENSYEMWIEVLEEVTIDTPVGRFDCFVVEPQLLTDGLFKRSGSLKVWLTRDDTHMPVMMQSKIKVGAISAILIEMQPGERGPLAQPAAMPH